MAGSTSQKIKRLISENINIFPSETYNISESQKEETPCLHRVFAFDCIEAKSTSKSSHPVQDIKTADIFQSMLQRTLKVRPAKEHKLINDFLLNNRRLRLPKKRTGLVGYSGCVRLRVFSLFDAAESQTNESSISKMRSDRGAY